MQRIILFILTTILTSECLYPSLELIKKKHGDELKIELEYNSGKVKAPSGFEFIYVCPADTIERERIEKSFPIFLYCLYITQKSKTMLHPIECKNKIEPYFWRYQDSGFMCGNDDKGGRYTYSYQICWESSSLYNKHITNFRKHASIKNLKRTHVEVYSVCLSQNQPIYVKYHFNVPSDQLQQILKSEDNNLPTVPNELRDNPNQELKSEIILDFQTHGDVALNLEEQRDLYNRYSKIYFDANLTENMDKIENGDRLIPQMLVSPKHLKANYSKNAPYNYVNVNPLWESLKNKWEYLDEFLRKLGQDKSLRLVMYSGTYEYLRKNNQNNVVLKKEGGNNTVKVALIWWKLLINNDKNGIVFAMQNVPKNYALETKKLCEKNVCNEYGWNVNEENDDTIYCCEFTEKLKLDLDLKVEKITLKNVFSLKATNPQMESKKKSRCFGFC